MKLTQEILKATFECDLETGRFTRILKSGRRGVVGARPGVLRPDGYRRLTVGDKSYYEHRLVWLYVHGDWPEYELDHIDGNRSNNAPSNLRMCTRSQNSQNIFATRNASGFKGVFRRPNSWAARIRVKGKLRTLGVFADRKDAARAYDEAAVGHFGAFAKTNQSLGLLP